MTKEGRLARGKANLIAKRFLNNSETLEYIASLPKVKPKEEEKPKEVKKDASLKR